MEWMWMWLFIAMVALAWAVLPFVALARTEKLRRELREAKTRLERLEAREWRRAQEEPLSVAATSAAAIPAPFEESFPPRLAPTLEPPRSAPPRDVARPAATFAAPSPAPRSGIEAEGLEDRIGSVWLQNAGAVVLLLGIFFFMLWGYTTGRFGPGWLVATGAAIGLVFAWRGDRLARSLPRLGHTFIGVGMGVVYLSLYLGHFTLRVLPLPVAFALLAITSFLSIGAGLRYKVQGIAALGVVGAFLPQVLSSWIPLHGFTLTPLALLGYLAVVDVLVFALAARAGWSALDLTALALTAVSWSAAFPNGNWGWSATAMLSVLFTGLGLAPIPRLAGTEGRVRTLDLAVIAGAPAALILCLASWLFISPRQPVAMLLFGLAAIQLAAALWVDSRRPERDLWQPLTAAATVFLTAGLQRLVGGENTAMVWCVEGVALVALGLKPRAGWLRFWGYVVTALAAMVAFAGFSPFDSDANTLPFVGADALRELVVMAGLITGATLLARKRDVLSASESWIPEAWTGIANLMLAIWIGRECDRFARALESPSGRWWRGVRLQAPAGNERETQLFAALASFAWFAQAAVLAGLGARKDRGFLRGCAYAIGGFALVVALTGLFLADGWSSDQRPVFYPSGLLQLASVVLAIGIAMSFAARRGELRFEERYAPEFWTVGVMLLLLAWSAREADHVARTVIRIPGTNGNYVVPVAGDAFTRVRTLGAALTSAAWLVQAIVLLALGWMRHAPFLRWAGLALIGVTLLKFAFYDLATADVLWRFITAIAAGAAMLAVSYAYQRRGKKR